MCATTLTYFLLDIVNKKNKIKFELSNLLIYVLLATVCDVMPMRNLNRIITINTLKKFDIKKNILFNILFQLHKKKDKFNSILLIRLWEFYYENVIDVIANIDYGYCITIHKSQGSTYNNVFVDIQNIIKNY